MELHRSPTAGPMFGNADTAAADDGSGAGGSSYNVLWPPSAPAALGRAQRQVTADTLDDGVSVGAITAPSMVGSSLSSRQRAASAPEGLADLASTWEAKAMQHQQQRQRDLGPTEVGKAAKGTSAAEVAPAAAIKTAGSNGSGSSVSPLVLKLPGESASATAAAGGWGGGGLKVPTTTTSSPTSQNSPRRNNSTSSKGWGGIAALVPSPRSSSRSIFTRSSSSNRDRESRPTSPSAAAGYGGGEGAAAAGKELELGVEGRDSNLSQLAALLGEPSPNANSSSKGEGFLGGGVRSSGSGRRWLWLEPPSVPAAREALAKGRVWGSALPWSWEWLAAKEEEHGGLGGVGGAGGVGKGGMWWEGSSWDLRGSCCHTWQAQKDKMRCCAVEEKEGLVITAGEPGMGALRGAPRLEGNQKVIWLGVPFVLTHSQRF